MRRVAIAAVIGAAAIFLVLPSLPFGQGWLDPAQSRAVQSVVAAVKALTGGAGQ